MNGTVVFVGVALFFIISGLINFINGLEDEVDQPSRYSKTTTSSYNEKYYGTNVVGEETLLLDGVSITQKRVIWNTSTLKNEMMEFFPNFSLMHEFIEDRMIDDSSFKKKLLDKIESAEEGYVGGTLTGEKAKAFISSY